MTYTKCGCKLCECTSFSDNQGICIMCEIAVHQDHFCINHLMPINGNLICERCKTTWVKERSE